jgi:hypothetical protein
VQQHQNLARSYKEGLNPKSITSDGRTDVVDVKGAMVFATATKEWPWEAEQGLPVSG